MPDLNPNFADADNVWSECGVAPATAWTACGAPPASTWDFAISWDGGPADDVARDLVDAGAGN